MFIDFAFIAQVAPTTSNYLKNFGAVDVFLEVCVDFSEKIAQKIENKNYIEISLKIVHL